MKKNSEPSDLLTPVIELLLGGPEGPSRAVWQDLLGVSGPALSQWSGGKNLPRPETLLKIILEAAQRPGGLDPEVRRAMDAIALQPAHETSSLLKKQGYESVSAYLATAVSARLAKRFSEVLPKLLPMDQLILLDRVQQMLDRRGGCESSDSATWLRGQFRVSENEIESVSQTFVSSVSENVRHSQMLSAVCRKHAGHDDEFLESVMFLTAWDSEEISLFSGQNRLDSSELKEEIKEPSEVVRRIKPQRATVRYGKLSSPRRIA